jgi:hypothetical protein
VPNRVDKLDRGLRVAGNDLNGKLFLAVVETDLPDLRVEHKRSVFGLP